MNRFCQSCGMPIKKDPQHGGTNSDGNRSTEYCSLCYQDGKFLDECRTAKEMQEFCINKMNEEGIPKFVTWILTRGIPKLNRWSA